MPDTLKGSFYGNPLLDRPEVDPTIQGKHPEYYKGNIWVGDPSLSDTSILTPNSQMNMKIKKFRDSKKHSRSLARL